MIQIEDGFTLFLRRRGNCPETIKIKTCLIKRLLREIPELTLRHIESWIETEIENEHTSRSINTAITAIRVYGQFLNNSEIASIKYLPEEQAVKSIMSDEEIERFLALSCPTSSSRHRTGKMFTRPVFPKWWERYKMYWTVLAYSGMRTGEVAALKIQDVDFGRNVFVLEHTKTKTPRYVPIAPNILSELKTYISELEGEYIFPARKNKHFTNHNWTADFTRRVQRLGIKRKGLTAYSLRHSFITRLLEEDVSIVKVMKIAGHANIKTTVGYTHLTTKDIQQAILKHPLIRQHTTPQETLRAVINVIKQFNLEMDERFFYKLEETTSSLRIEIFLK